MTTTDLDLAEPATPPSPPSPAPAAEAERQADPHAPTTTDDELPSLRDLIRPTLAAALATAAAGLVAGGIFGSWWARLTGLVGAFAGAGWAPVALRSKRAGLARAVFPFLVVAAGAILLVPRGESPGDLVTLMGDALSAGKLFRPPVPYDPGWTPILFILTAVIGFAVAWVGTALERPKLAVAVPLPAVVFTAITQPDDGKFVAGVCAFIPILAAVAVLFGGDTDRASELDRQFEVKRALRGVLVAVPLIGLLVVFGNASFLFPEPVYDPTEQPQKPKAIPLSEQTDRVLFEVRTSSDLTGPWHTGALDVYDPDDGFWKSPPRSLRALPADGQLGDVRGGAAPTEVTIMVRDLGNSSVFPTVGGATHIAFAGQRPSALRYDTRTEVVRVETGRVPPDSTYTLTVPRYPTADELKATAVPKGGPFATQLDVPDPPPAIRQLLLGAPTNPWERLDVLRQKLLTNIVASGAGTPVEMRPRRVAELFEKDAEATPYEIVAAEALLARWTGVPSRIGFGFDGLNTEGDLLTVRPRNSAQWLEVYFESIGWTPLIGAPKQAKASLDTDQARFEPGIEPSDDIAVEVYLPFERRPLRHLYERIRDQLLRWAPLIVVLALAWLTWPVFAKAYRRSKRRRWAAALGPRVQIAVEYAELRDLATDLNVASVYSTPLEYLFEVKDDEEHIELAWLVARAVYGDLALTVGPDDVAAAESMSASVRRRLLRAQPAQSQVLAYLSRASLRQPYSTEMPNVGRPRLLARVRLPRLLHLRRLRRLRRGVRPAVAGS